MMHRQPERLIARWLQVKRSRLDLSQGLIIKLDLTSLLAQMALPS